MTYRSLLDFVSPPLPPPLLPHISKPSNNAINPITSILIIALILAIVFLVSASLHLLLRFLDRFHPHSSSDVEPFEENQEPHVDNPIYSHVPTNQQILIDSLPLFSFSSLGPHKSGGADCAVCISRFEPHDQLRLLPNCCHAFHSRCIDTWLSSNRTCPLCRSSVHVEDFESANAADVGSTKSSSVASSFRLEIGSVSRRREELPPEDAGIGNRRSYSMGSFDYVLDDDVAEVVVVGPTAHHRRGISECAGGAYHNNNKDDNPAPPGADVANAAGERSWLMEYVERLASSSFSSRALSFRLSGRISGAGSSRRSDGSFDLEGNPVGEETSYSQFFSWLGGT
ncbi:E3 ubiquitin-protein ligase ATL4-like [Tasmannia lanceolata]|uniref:E3 ubiquitin-protein ligase ATL4-like n=1 Tax=Tasmannia lanceolata TaxID=3420 RepID=UPI00406488A2